MITITYETTNARERRRDCRTACELQDAISDLIGMAEAHEPLLRFGVQWIQGRDALADEEGAEHLASVDASANLDDEQRARAYALAQTMRSGAGLHKQFMELAQCDAPLYAWAMAIDQHAFRRSPKAEVLSGLLSGPYREPVIMAVARATKKAFADEIARMRAGAAS